MDFDLHALPTPDLGLKCLKCNYPLDSLSERRCPECGTAFEYDMYLPSGDFPPLFVEGNEVLLTRPVMNTLASAGIPFIPNELPSDEVSDVSFLIESRPPVRVLREMYFEAVYLIRRLQRGDFAAQDWTCPACAEKNPDSFEICWQCDFQRSTDLRPAITIHRMDFDLYALPTPDLGLRCLTCNYPLGGLTERRCPECNTAIEFEDFIPRGDFPPLIVEGKEVTATPDVLDALGRAKIPFIQIVGPVEGIYGLSSPGIARARVGVPRGQYFEAIDILRRQRRGEILPLDDRPLPDWKCANCGEDNPGTFEICWQCATSMGND